MSSDVVHENRSFLDSSNLIQNDITLAANVYEYVPSIASTGTPHFVFTSGPGAATPQYCL